MSKVRFDLDKTTVGQSVFSAKNDCWYSNNELMKFKIATKMHIEVLRQICLDHDHNELQAKEFFCRGLEQKASLDRQRRKAMIAKLILRVQNELKANNFEKHEIAKRLRNISSRATLYASELALNEARLECSEAVRYFIFNNKISLSKLMKEIKEKSKKKIIFDFCSHYTRENLSYNDLKSKQDFKI